jgi:hypothetical protein
LAVTRPSPVTRIDDTGGCCAGTVAGAAPASTVSNNPVMNAGRPERIGIF